MHERPAIWMSSAQQAWRPPAWSSHPRPPHWPHAAGQQAAMPCEPEMLPAGHSHLPAATMGSAAAAASTRMACEGSLQWLARFVRYGGRHAVHGTMWYHGTLLLGTMVIFKQAES